METELIQLLSDHSDTSLIALFMAWFAVSQRKSAKSHRSLQEEVQPNGGRSLRDAVESNRKNHKSNQCRCCPFG